MKDLDRAFDGERVSLIVAVYNIAPYIGRCVASIQAQTWQNLEILLVDDGSTDDSGRLCDGFAASDGRIRVIHKANGGLSSARNAGLEAATGDYIMFVDGDDAVKPAMVGTLMGLLKDHGADIAQCNYEECQDSADPLADRWQSKPRGWDDEHPGKVTRYHGKAVGMQLFANYPVSVVQWNKLYRREILRGLRYPEGFCHEDEFVIAEELVRCRVLVYTPEALYRYYRRPGSITTTPTLEKQYHAALGYARRLETFHGAGYRRCTARSLYMFLLFIYQTLWFPEKCGGVSRKAGDGAQAQWLARLAKLRREVVGKYWLYMPLVAARYGKALLRRVAAKARASH